MQLAHRQAHQVDDEGRAEAPVHGDAVRIESRDQSHQVGVRRDDHIVPPPAVTHEGQSTQRRVDQMSGDGAHVPRTGARRPPPVLVGKRREEVYEQTVELLEEMERVDHRMRRSRLRVAGVSA